MRALIAGNWKMHGLRADLAEIELIAATASVRGAMLVHRDPHFTAIPIPMLKQEMLPPK